MRKLGHTSDSNGDRFSGCVPIEKKSLASQMRYKNVNFFYTARLTGSRKGTTFAKLLTAAQATRK